MSDSNYELQVSGSACTLFEDTENYTSVNEGVTLIPWMGDRTNMIDRYDVRGHLYSETEFGLRRNAIDVDPVEAELEDQLDKERFMFLTVDELEFEAYLEEEEKRFNSKKEAGGSYLQVGFSYTSNVESPTVAEQGSIVDEVYVPCKMLGVPDHMKTPETEKQYKIIEKTAAFLSTQNLQTELVIRTKQKDNPQFHFLEPDNELNPFYKHVISAIKRKIIIVKSEPKPKPKPAPVPQPQIPTAAERHKQYELEQLAQQHIAAQQHLAVQQHLAQQQQLLLQQQQQQYEQQLLLQQQQLINNAKGLWNKLGGEVQHVGEAKEGVGSSLAALSAYGAASDDDSSDEDDNNNNAPNLHNMINKMSKPIPVPPGTSPEVIQYLIMSGFVALPPPAPGLPQLLVPPSGHEGFTLPTIAPPPPPEDEVELTTEEDAEDCQDEQRPPSPSPEQKGIITKLAEYVVKNGDSFERKVLQKQDQRFQFVNPGNEHHNYYQYLIQKFRNKRVKLNVAPIKMKTKSNPLKAAPVDNTVFNQSSSEEEEEEGEEEENEETSQSSPQTRSPATSQSPNNLVPSPSPTHNPQYSPPPSPVVSPPPEQPDATDPAPIRSTSSVTQNSPHPLDSDHESPPTSPSRYDNNSDDRHPLDSPVKTPVYTNENVERTPSPTNTPKGDQTQTPEIRSPVDSPSPNLSEESDAESIDSETKGKPLVQHFSDESGDDSRYDLDGNRSRSKSISPVRSRSKTKSPVRERSKSKSPVHDVPSKSPSPDRSSSKKERSKTPDSRKNQEKEEKSKSKKLEKEERHARRKREEEILRKKEEILNKREEIVKKKEELLKKKEDELPEEGELSDDSSKKRHKHNKKHKDRDRHRSQSPSKHKKKKKDKSRKRNKSSDSEYRSPSIKKMKTEHKEQQKRKRLSPPKKNETEEWMSEKMKKLSKIELLKEIEDKIEEKKRLRENTETNHQPNTVSDKKENKPSEKKENSLSEKKEISSIEKKENNSIEKKENNSADKIKKETKPIEKRETRSSHKKEALKLNDKKETKPSNKKEVKIDEEKRLAIERELEKIEAKLEAKKIKKQKETAEVKKNTRASEKVNGHTDKAKRKRGAKESGKLKKS